MAGRSSATIFIQTKIKSMTNYQMGLFSKMIDLNWEIDNGGYNQVVKNALTEYYCKVREELIDDMGAAEFKEYMRMGREMFAPAE